jgi:hypothetical protein
VRRGEELRFLEGTGTGGMGTEVGDVASKAEERGLLRGEAEVVLVMLRRGKGKRRGKGRGKGRGSEGER